MADKMARPAVRTSISTRFCSHLAAASLTLAASCVLLTGCGKSEVAEAPASDQSPAANPVSAVSSASPTDVVSQFLDQVRRGGANSDAGKYLTTKAQSELKRIGRTVQPIGSPAAHFDVIQAVPVPQEDNAMLVESRWTEPNQDGTKSEFQVVWSVEKEAAGWRISGLAILMEGTETPEIVDFENGTMMAQLLQDDAPAQQAATSQAAGSTQAVPAQATANQATAPSGGLNR